MTFTEKHRETVKAYLNLEPFTGRDRSRCVALRALMASHDEANTACDYEQKERRAAEARIDAALAVYEAHKLNPWAGVLMAEALKGE